MGALFSASSVSIDSSVDRALEIRQLKEEIAALKQDNNELRREMMRELNREIQQQRSAAPPKQPSEVSVLKVDTFVEKMLSDPATNLGFVPDVIERGAQRTMLLFLLKSMAHAVDTASIELLGHEIVLRMQPIQEEYRNLGEEGAASTLPPQYDDYNDSDYSDSLGDQEGVTTTVNAHDIPL